MLPDTELVARKEVGRAVLRTVIQMMLFLILVVCVLILWLQSPGGFSSYRHLWYRTTGQVLEPIDIGMNDWDGRSSVLADYYLPLDVVQRDYIPLAVVQSDYIPRTEYESQIAEIQAQVEKMKSDAETQSLLGILFGLF